jgi:general secretion pathway protein D
VDLAYVISALAQAASLNVVYSDLPQKTVTLRTSQAVSESNVAGLIRDLAASNGVSVTETNGFMRLQGVQGQGEQGPPRLLYIQKLKHARAPILAQTLQSLFGGVVRTNSAAQAANTLSQQLRALEIQSAQARAQGQQVPQQIFTIPQIRAGELQDNVTIVPDEVTNSLLIRATANDWQIVQQAIQSLDLRPLQVVIEVIIAEVRRTNDLNVGVSVAAEKVRGDNSTTAVLPGLTSDNSFSLGIIRAGDVNIEATLSALATSGNVRILSRPIVHAQNNQEARILVGSQRPFVQVAQTLPTDQASLQQVVQYRDVGTSLTITPTINDEGYVNLVVTQEVSQATAEVQFDAPVISTREAQTQILARHGQTVVIGGLVDRQNDKTRSGIPLLKDIPILGYLFSSTRETTTNSELFIFLTPYIVATDEDADRVRQWIEDNSHLLRGVVPVDPLTPRVIRIPADTIRGGEAR